MDTLVSVVVPAYNAARTLLKTTDDLFAQSHSDYEMILVDDGSADATPALCDRLAAEDSRVVVIHQQNGGLSNARNHATMAAQGDYVTYIDSDDRVDKQYLEYLIRALEDTQADFVSGLCDRARETKEHFEPVGDFCVECLDQREALSALVVGRLPVGACCKLGTKEAYLQNPFWEGKYYEDLSNTYRLLLQQAKVALVRLPMYHYIMRGGSITGRKRTTYRQCMDYYEAIHSCWDGVVSKYPDLKGDAAVLRARDYMSLYLSIHRCPESSETLAQIEQEIKGWMKQHWKSVFENEKAPLEFRMRLLLFGINPTLYERAYYIGIHVKGKAIS